MVPQWVTASQARIAKHTGTADALLGSVRPGKVVSRRDLASVVGKYQFLAPLVKGVQNMLVPAYRARDRFTAPVVETWDPAQRHSGDGSYLTEHWATPEGVPAPTMDASGWQGGIAYRDRRHILSFPRQERAPHKSSNFRESSTAAAAVEHMGPSHRGGRMLLRTDNTTTMSMFDLELAAEHILGVENTLSDGLSRYVRRKDYSYWQFRRDEFLSVQDLFTRLFTLDGGAHPVGTNAHLPRYWSVVDGFEDTPVDG
ncbi:hypothetical protein CYMTET_13788 [Cymbomonas tetramitiformis]|uniref:Uncharacterized protein n=1 Tax=Cymbomonas tetramitiformis TaxID=36881 RepID=A0AAE0GHX8_9CHLO|nr:hypothetical protein CYMTET_13788 [Cymbomonas tetramitiformis]